MSVSAPTGRGATTGSVGPQPTISLLEVDVELAGVVPSADRPLADRVLRAPLVEIEPGAADVTELVRAPSSFAVLVISGELTCEIEIGERSLPEVLTAGDVLTPWEPDIDGLVVQRALFAVSPVRLAVLEHRFLLACGRWPGLMVLVQRRLADREHRRAVHGAICQFARVEDRLLAMLRLVGSRTGRIGPDGLVVPLNVTHEAIGRLIGARRSTVSLAIKELQATGRARRRAEGDWLVLDRDESGQRYERTHASRVSERGAGPGPRSAAG